MADEPITSLEIDLLQPNPLQPRGIITPESLIELVDSVREHGILEPLIVAETPAGYQIIAGERRWRAAKIANFKKVPCIIKQTSPRGMLEMSIVENVQREDLNPIERAQAYKRLQEEFGMTTSEVAQRVGKSPSYISNSLRLLSLPDALKDAMVSKMVSEGHIRALAAIEDRNQMIAALRQVLTEEGSVRRAEELAREYKSKGQIRAKKEIEKIYSEELSKLQNEMAKALGGKVRISQSRVQAKVVISINQEIEKTTDLLRKLHRIILGEFEGK